jgi:hypothetical protein
LQQSLLPLHAVPTCTQAPDVEEPLEDALPELPPELRVALPLELELVGELPLELELSVVPLLELEVETLEPLLLPPLELELVLW